MESNTFVEVNLSDKNIHDFGTFIAVFPKNKYLIIKSKDKQLLRTACIDYGLLGFLKYQLHNSPEPVAVILQKNIDFIKETATNPENKEKEWELLNLLSDKKYLKTPDLVSYFDNHCEHGCCDNKCHKSPVSCAHKTH
jgi:hypothetical protein